MVIDPATIKKFPASGNGNMGDVTDLRSTCRFALPTQRYALNAIRARFIDGTGDADLAIRVDSRYAEPTITVVGGGLKTTPYDFVLFTLRDCGTDGNAAVHFRIPEDEIKDWTFDAGDVLVLEWTNPNTQRWAVEVSLVPIGTTEGNTSATI